jgi:hypothetical protein
MITPVLKPALLPGLLCTTLLSVFLWTPFATQAQTGDCNCTNCPQFLPDLFTGNFNLTVQNASNPILGQNGQGVCGVIVHFDHTAICDISMTLVAPSGQSVTLIGPIGQFCSSNGNAGTDWYVTFLPCNDPNVAPDPGFSNTWNNNQNWGANNNYTGSYYPFTGCLQNLTGPVNGDWSLLFVDGQANDVGNLYDYEIIFCDPSGIDCFTCAADAGELLQPDVVGCEGDAALNLSLPPTYAAPAMPPPAALYDYTYIIAGTGGVIQAFDPGPDLSAFAAGNYTVCGLSYYSDNQDDIPVPNGSLTIAQLNTQLNSNSPPFCGEISSNCVGVTIKPTPPDVEETVEICAPDCYTFLDYTFCQSGTYTVSAEENGCTYTGTLNLTVYQPDIVQINEVICPGTCSQNPSFPGACATGSYQTTLTGSNGCDSIVFLNLTVVNIAAAIQQPAPEINCDQDTVVLQGITPPGATYLWTASNGGHIAGPANEINAAVDSAGVYHLRACRSQLGVFCCDTASVTVISNKSTPPAPALSGNDTLCSGQTDSFWVVPLAGASAYTWTFPPGVTILTGQDSAWIQVAWNAPSGGNVCVTAVNDCGPGTPSCLPVTVYTLPASPQPIGDTLVCTGDTVIYASLPIAGADAYDWQISGGTLLSGNGSDSVTVVWNGNTPNGTVCAVATGFCGSSPQSCLQVAVNTAPAQPVISGDGTLCTGTAGTYAVAPVNGALSYTWTIPAGNNLLSGQNTNSIEVDWLAPPGGAVCATAQGACGTSPQQCFPVQVWVQPAANAGTDGALCDTATSLSALSSVQGSTGIWTALPGAPGTAAFSHPDAAQTGVTVSEPGVYLFQWTEISGICTDSDTVQIDFNTAPVIGTIQSDCDSTNQFYVIAFPVSGGVAPYAATGGNVVNGMFTSDPLISGQPYNFTLTDNNGCSTPLVNGNVNCNCSSDAGQMSLQPLSACPGFSVTAQHQGGVLDGNDIGMFVLHTSPTASLGVVTAQNASGVFSYGAGMIYGVTYYVSYVVGNNLNGTPDPNDPCLSVTQGQPVTFYDNPAANAGPDQSLCGLTLPLNGNAGAGTVLWTVVNSPAGASLIIQNPQNPSTTVNAGQFGTYTLRYTVSANGCSGSDDVNLQFNASPNTGLVTAVCDGINQNFTVSFSISGGTPPYFANGSPVVGANFQSALIPSGSVYNFAVTDANGCSAPVVSGSFNCNCSTSAGQMSLAPLSACAGETITAQYLGGQNLDNNDVFAYALHTNAGSTLGTIIAQNTTGVFSFGPGMTYGVTYYVSRIAGNNLNGIPDPSDPCLSVSQGQPVVFHDLPVLTALSEDCNGTNTAYSVSFLAGGGTAPYTVSGLNGSFTGNMFESTVLAPGSTYSFTLTDANGCSGGSFTGSHTCNCVTNAGTMAVISADFCAGQPATATWNNNPTLDADDIVQFVLHSAQGNALGTVFAVNNQPVFSLTPPLQTGVTYYVSAVAGNNTGGGVDLNDPCLHVAPGTPVRWKPLPVAALSGDTTLCAGASTPLRFQGSGSYPLSVTYSTGSGTPLTVVIPGSQQVVVPVNPQSTTTYTMVSVSDGTAPVCTTALQDAATVTVFSYPVADAGPDQTILCGQTAVTIGGNNTSSGAGISYQWTYLGTPAGTTKQVAATNAGDYSLLVTNAGGCTASDVVRVGIDNSLPAAGAIRVKEIKCFGDNNGSIRLDSISSSRPPVLFSLNGGPFLPVAEFDPLAPGQYVVTLQDASGCEWRTDTILIAQPQQVVVELGSTVEVKLGDAVFLNALASVPADQLQLLQWRPLLDTANAQTFIQQFTPFERVNVEITITDSSGCTASDEVSVIVRRPQEVFIPNAIQPGAAPNERLVVFAGSSVAAVEYMRVYDRWGGYVYEDMNFEPNDFAHGWDGKIKGAEASPGVYVYYVLVRYINGRTELFTGDVTVLR